MPQGSDLKVPWGVWRSFFYSKFNQILCTCMSYLHEWHMHQHNFWVPAPWGLGEGPKGQISLNLNYKVNYKGFYTKLCVSSHKWKIYYIYQTGFSFCHLGYAQGRDLRVPWGVGGQFFFSEIQPDLVCELLTWMAHAPARFFGSLPPGALGRGQKFNFLNMVMCHIKLKGMSSRPL